MQVIPVASSSDGNCTLVKSQQATILIDCGISMKALVSSVGLDTVQNLDAIFVTHEHSDHIRGVGPLGRKYTDLPIFINKLSYQCRGSDFYNIKRFELIEGKPIRVANLNVTPFNVEHDSANTFGFFVDETHGNNLCLMLDTGKVNDASKEFMQEADILIIESNYDERGLMEYPGYSPSHKARIRRVHLENRQSFAAIDKVGVDSFKEIYLGHISPRTNNPELVSSQFKESFPDYKGEVCTAPQWCSYALERYSYLR